MLKPLLFSILILVSGIVIGSGITLMVMPQQTSPDLPPMPEFVSERMVGRMMQELHLSPQQQEQLKPIITKRMSAIDAIRTEAQPKIRQEIEAMNEEILAILDNAQKQLWQDRIKRMQEGFQRMHRRRPGEERRDQDEPRMGPGGTEGDRNGMHRPRRGMPDELPLPSEGALPPRQPRLNQEPPVPEPPLEPAE
ncbi:MAG: hypothetical protein L0Y36_10280 [Planctomycetales bacterium]|nr:hypothetical protein [Planctomycetales bacterium]